ncbi:MAG: iron-containing alcohol dehydrogenase family protein [Haloferacaceae archaeon]
MIPIHGSFEFDYAGCDVVYGRGTIESLDAYFDDYGFEDALVVCGTNVGRNDELMDLVRHGLGSRLAGVFDETTPEKTGETVYDGIETMREVDADVLVGLGGGSSLDVARQMSAFAADGRSLAEFRDAARDGDLTAPVAGDAPTPVAVVPTTLAGAGISDAGSMRILPAEESPTGGTIRTGGSVMPVAAFYDPDVFETTPPSALAGSAMNGFDKGIETIYARNGTALTDGTAIHSLRLFRESLPHLVGGEAAGDEADRAIDRAVVAVVLAQFDRRISVVHAFGHGFSRHYSVHQGVVHGVVAPHVLRYVFDEVDARRSLIARGLGLDPTALSAERQAEAIVDAVADLRDSLGLPSRLRELDELDADDLPLIAEFVLEDEILSQGPEAFGPTVERVESVLRKAW